MVGTSLGEGTIPLGELETQKPTIVVLGNEGHGLRTLVQRSCDNLVRIEKSGGGMIGKHLSGEAAGAEGAGEEGGSGSGDRGDVDSLNVSVSGGILLYHLLYSK